MHKTLQSKTKNEPTLKQRKWLQVYIKTGNATEAAMQVYDCKDRDSAATIGYENVQKLDYPAFLEASGITDKLLTDKINEGLESTKIITSHTEPDREVSDMPTRHKYLETALKLKTRLVERDVVVVSDKTLILDAVNVTTHSVPL